MKTCFRCYGHIRGREGQTQAEKEKFGSHIKERKKLTLCTWLKRIPEDKNDKFNIKIHPTHSFDHLNGLLMPSLEYLKSNRF